MQYPTIHLNGSSKKQLIEDLSSANNALFDTIEALSKCAPHQRDYYVNPDKNAFPVACKEHRERIGQLLEVKQEIVSIMCAIEDQDQENEMKKRKWKKYQDLLTGQVIKAKSKKEVFFFLLPLLPENIKEKSFYQTLVLL